MGFVLQTFQTILAELIKEVYFYTGFTEEFN